MIIIKVTHQSRSGKITQNENNMNVQYKNKEKIMRKGKMRIKIINQA